MEKIKEFNEDAIDGLTAYKDTFHALIWAWDNKIDFSKIKSRQDIKKLAVDCCFGPFDIEFWEKQLVDLDVR